MSLTGQSKMMIFSGTSTPQLAQCVCDALDVELSKMKIREFADSELSVLIEEPVRGNDVYVIQSTSKPGYKHLMELFIIIDALRRASAYRVNLVIPYFGYARQDRKTAGREPITARLVANLLEASGADRVVSVDLHTGQLQGFFNIPVDNLSAISVLTDYFRKKFAQEIKERKVTVVSPDHGGVVRARKFSAKLSCIDGESFYVPLSIVDKSRDYTTENKSKAMSIIGENNIQGKICILVDDMVDSGGTLVHAARLLLEHGATEVYACATHGVLSGNATKNLLMLYKKAGEVVPDGTILENGALSDGDELVIKELILTDTIPLDEHKDLPNLVIPSVENNLTIAPLLAKVIHRIHTDSSVSELFR